MLAGSVLCVAGDRRRRGLRGPRQEAGKAEKHQIPGGIAGHIKGVDAEKLTLTIVAESGADRTFRVGDETLIAGPRGGKVRQRLRDRRFHEGMEVTIVANGAMAEEIHLGYDRSHAGVAAGATAAKGTSKPGPAPAAAAAAKGGAAGGPPKATSAGPAAKPAAADEEDEDDEVPGTVKSYNPERRLLVVSLVNGTSRSFFLSKDLKVMVGRAVSKAGVADPALKPGAHVIVLLDNGGRRVNELRVEPAPAVRRLLKKAS